MASTAVVVTANVTLVAPAATVTFAGTVAEALVLASVTTAPPEGAAPLNVTVPVDAAPPTRLDGASVRADKTGGLMVSALASVAPPKTAEIVTGVMAATAVVVTGNVAVVDPAAIVTLAGTDADVLVLESATDEPPSGATPLRVTVPVELAPPVKLAGTRASAATTGGLMVSTAICVAPPKAAEIVAVVTDATAVVITGNVELVAPAATVTLVGTIADALALDRATTAPPTGAGPLNVTVPVDVAPPIKLAGARASAATVTGIGLMVSTAD